MMALHFRIFKRPPAALRALGLLLAVCFFSICFAQPASAELFDDDGGSGSAWINMLRGNGPAADCKSPGDCVKKGLDPTNYYGITGWIADPAASNGFAAALRLALNVYSNALLIVGSIILLYHLLVMVTETAHQGVVGGKRANQIWAPIRLVIAIGLLVPLAGGLNSAQYITLQIVQWGSNLASTVWAAFLGSSGSGSGTSPTPSLPDTSSIAREAALIGACKGVINNTVGVTEKEKIKPKPKFPLLYGNAMVLYGNEEQESLCGSVVFFSGGIASIASSDMSSILASGVGSIAGMMGIDSIINSVEAKAGSFVPGTPAYYTDPGPVPSLALTLGGAISSVMAKSHAPGGSSGSGWVGAGSWFLNLAAGNSSHVSASDTLPIVIGPKAG
ncbi:MAG TPA: hypothetical protein VHB73_03905, partial [Alphaproteobacteria bacterium]|nr:hypothetical protein [Alphaproteobacteria bacterium]